MHKEETWDGTLTCFSPSAFAYDFFEVVKDLFGPQGRHGVHKFVVNLLYDFGRTLGSEAQRNSAKPKIDGWRECSALRSS